MVKVGRKERPLFRKPESQRKKRRKGKRWKDCLDLDWKVRGCRVTIQRHKYYSLVPLNTLIERFVSVLRDISDMSETRAEN